MKKISLMLVFLFFVGCASTSELQEVSDRLSVTESKLLETRKQLSDVKQHTEKCDIEMRSCAEHCKGLNSKIDRVFKKAQQK